MAVQRTTSVVSEEELQLRKRARRRLVGAIALVALAVIVVPLVLDHEPRESLRNVQVEMAPLPAPAPQPPAQPAEPVNSPVVASAPNASEPAPVTSPAPGPPAQPLPAQPPAAPKTRAAAAPVAAPLEPTPSAAARKPPAQDQFVIQLGAFADPERAQALQGRLRGAGIPVYLERVRDPNRTRVRAGPYPSREAAQRAYQQMSQRGLTDPATLGQIVPKGQ
jgi:DedD protein